MMPTPVNGEILDFLFPGSQVGNMEIIKMHDCF
jgi:hypothetical protein